MQLQLKVYVVG